ncbi:MAG: FAD-dependent oxidoreductase, partial [Pseudomonadota bacterium]|nr:FAD-dependent oxidoreductase [Pseudomonadota bacterium]
MKRLYEPAAYGPQQGCFWAETVPAMDWPVLQDSTRADVVIIGAGFTGLSAALHLAQAGMDVVVLEAETPGYGASGRNGGFCCLGGSKLSNSAIARQHGPEGVRDWAKTEVAAVDTVRSILDDHRIDADVHSDGETLLAHNARAFAGLQKHAMEQKTLYGV